MANSENTPILAVESSVPASSTETSCKQPTPTACKIRIMEMANLHMNQNNSEEEKQDYLKAVEELRNHFDTFFAYYDRVKENRLAHPGGGHDDLSDAQWMGLDENVQVKAPRLKEALKRPEINLKEVLDLVSFLNIVDTCLSSTEFSSKKIKKTPSVHPILPVQVVSKPASKPGSVGEQKEDETSGTPHGTVCCPLLLAKSNISKLAENIPRSSKAKGKFVKRDTTQNPIKLNSNPPSEAKEQTAPPVTSLNGGVCTPGGSCSLDAPKVQNPKKPQGPPKTPPAAPVTTLNGGQCTPGGSCSNDPPIPDGGIGRLSPVANGKRAKRPKSPLSRIMEEEVEIEGNVNTTMHPQASSKAPNKEFQSQLISTLFPQANHKPRLGRSESLLYWLLQDHPEDEEIPYFCRGKDRKALFRLIVCLWAEPIVGTGPFDREWTKLVREREMKRWADVEKEDDVGAVTILVLMSLMGAGIGMSFTRVEIAPKKQIGRGAANVSPLAAAGHGPGDCCSSPYPISPSPKGGVPSFPSPPSRGPKQSICPMCKKSGDISTDCPCALSLLQGLGVFAPTIPESVLRLGNASPSTKSGHSRHERVARGTRSHRNPCARNENDSTVDFTDNSQSFYTPPSIIRCSKSDISTRKSVSFVSFEDNEEQDIATEPDLSSSTDLSITSAVSKINKWQIENGISGIRKRAIKKTVRISANEYRYSPTFIPWPDTPKPAIGSPEVVMGSGDTSQYVSCQGQPLLEFGTPEEAGTVDCTPPLVPLDLGKAGARAVPVPVDVGQVLAAASLQLCTSKKQRVTKRSGGSGKRMARRSSSSLRFSDEWSEK